MTTENSQLDYRAIEQLDASDAKVAESALKTEWGNEYATNVRLVSQHLDNLSETERERIENEALPDGRLPLNDPAYSADLARKARSGSETKAEIEELMRDPGSKYWKGADALRIQARYRDLLRGS
ncbi:MAG: hypothetical protein IT488_10470 [Gammaproteobacteria bacterium]|nr:hypothetical protein [Gammaproteobacteria bacterium]